MRPLEPPFPIDHNLIEVTGGDSQSWRVVCVHTLTTARLSSEETARLQAWLSRDERERARQFLRAEDRRDFIAAHALVRMQLHDHFPWVALPAPVARSEPGGKPRLVGHPNIDFNISHTRGMAACASSANSDIGIDCETLDRAVDLRISEICFSPEERTWLRNQTKLAPRHAFLHLWTLKEAAIKAIGLGLQTDLKAFTVLPFPPRLVEAGSEFGNAKDWALRQWTTSGGFIVALATRAPRA